MTDQMVGSVTDIELHFDSGDSKVEVGYLDGQVLLEMSELDLLGLEMDSK